MGPMQCAFDSKMVDGIPVLILHRCSKISGLSTLSSALQSPEFGFLCDEYLPLSRNVTTVPSMIVFSPANTLAMSSGCHPSFPGTGNKLHHKDGHEKESSEHDVVLLVDGLQSKRADQHPKNEQQIRRHKSN